MTTSDTHPGGCRILALDGGGAKGFYTLGVLSEVEAMVGTPLAKQFDLIFGTSTGSIIASLLGLGHSVAEIHRLYKLHVPTVMRAWTRGGRSEALASLAATVFGERKFDDFHTGIGIVATRWDLEKPMIFKSRATQAHGRRATFVPGFGVSIADAVRASCSAYPFFTRQHIALPSGSTVEVVDGGYCANNPTLYAIADATMALGHARAELRVLSVGVGHYPEPRRLTLRRLAKRIEVIRLLQKTLDVNTASMEQLRSILYSDVPTERISDTFERPELATDLLEHDLEKLDLLFQRGVESFARREAAIRALLAPFHTSGVGQQ